MDLLNIFPEIKHFLPLAPVLLVGFLSGGMSYLNSECENAKCAIKIITTSAFLSFIVFSLLSASDLPYLAKVGASAAVGYFGIERALDLISRIIAFRSAPRAQQEKENNDKKAK